MKRLVRYQLNFESKWLTLSGVMMGIAFFLQALDYFALRQLSALSLWDLIIWLILPMFLEALWCVPLRSELWKRAEAHGIFSALICLVLLTQTIMTGGVFPIVMGSVFYVIGAAAAVLITFGFIAHRALGMLVFCGCTAMWVLVFGLPGYVANPGYLTLAGLIPSGCLLLSMTFFYGGIRYAEA
jgi:hypothetical protein